MLRLHRKRKWTTDKHRDKFVMKCVHLMRLFLLLVSNEFVFMLLVQLLSYTALFHIVRPLSIIVITPNMRYTVVITLLLNQLKCTNKDLIHTRNNFKFPAFPTYYDHHNFFLCCDCWYCCHHIYHFKLETYQHCFPLKSIWTWNQFDLPIHIKGESKISFT